MKTNYFFFSLLLFLFLPVISRSQTFDDGTPSFIKSGKYNIVAMKFLDMSYAYDYDEKYKYHYYGNLNETSYNELKDCLFSDKLPSSSVSRYVMQAKTLLKYLNRLPNHRDDFLSINPDDHQSVSFDLVSNSSVLTTFSVDTQSDSSSAFDIFLSGAEAGSSYWCMYNKSWPCPIIVGDVKGYLTDEARDCNYYVIVPRDSFVFIYLITSDESKAQAAFDKIYSTDGKVVNAVIEEIGQENIKYKKSTNLGPTYVIPRSSVSKIVFSNGEVELFSDTEKYVEPKNTQNSISSLGNDTVKSSYATQNSVSQTSAQSSAQTYQSQFDIDGFRTLEYDKMKASADGLHTTADVGFWVGTASGLIGLIICACTDQVDGCWIPLVVGGGSGLTWFFVFEAIAAGKDNAAYKLKYSSSYLMKKDFDINGSILSMGPVRYSSKNHMTANGAGVGVSLSF